MIVVQPQAVLGKNGDQTISMATHNGWFSPIASPGRDAGTCQITLRRLGASLNDIVLLTCTGMAGIRKAAVR